MSTISLCMIVRDEGQTLERCLSSVAGIPDEIVIVDTGSRDGTKQIAAKFTSRVLDFTWIDDFSAARNYAFEQATTDYIMWLDADDVLLPDDRAKLLSLKGALTPDVDAVSMMYHTSFDASNNVTKSARRLRLVRRLKNFTWAGVVHEDLTTTGEYRLLNSDIAVTHKKEIDESGPSRRNLEIFERFFQAGGRARPTDIFHYARDLELHKEYEKAVPQYLQFIAMSEAGVDLRIFALNRLATCYYNLGDLTKEWECTLKSLELDVPRPEFSCRFGERFLANNQFRQAAFWYQLALDYVPEGGSDIATENYPFRTWLPHKQLALCYFQLGDYAKSLHHNTAASTYLPEDEGIASNIQFLRGIVNQSA